MHIHTSTIVVGVSLCLAASSAAGQQRPQPRRTAPPVRATAHVPDAGMIAVGGSISPITATNSSFLDNGLAIAGNVEAYLSPRLSVRGQIGTAWWDITGLSYTGSIQPVFFLGNLVYNWENGAVHPYVTGGGGMYRYGFTEAALAGPEPLTGSTTKAGFDFGGGVEYFFMPDAAITGEGLFHRVGTVPTERATLGFKGSFWSFTVGGKKYF